MSAFMCSDDHIDGILSYAKQNKAYLYPHGYANEADLTKVGRILILENARSVGHRYHKETNAAVCVDVVAYKFKDFPRKISQLEALKACDCFDYQACENDDYEQSAAADLIRRIRGCAIRDIPGYRDANGWELKR